MSSAPRPGPGRPYPLGASLADSGINIAVFSAEAEAIDVCLFDAAGHETRWRLPAHTDDVWHGHFPGLGAGQRYGLRAHGPWAPERGLRFNPHKLLLDPYARAFDAPLVLRDELCGHTPGATAADLTFDPRDSAPFMPRCVVYAPPPPVGDSERPRTPWADTVLYETHVRGYTMHHPGIPAAARGRFVGLAHAEAVAWLRALGISAVELLPVHAFTDERALRARGLVNYWGYNSYNFFAPHAAYGDVASLRALVRTLHEAGIEVILDVVYNHTAETDELGPTLSFRGLDNRSYYRLREGGRFYVNHTGCGNTLNLAHPRVLQLALDSLRAAALDFGVDGFRFDLATTLGREADDGFDSGCGFFDALRADPLLGTLKLLAEPWDIGHGGYRVGDFPPPFAQWNDRFRDGVRRYWRGDAHVLPELARRLHGSADLFQPGGRGPAAGVNYVTSHDGFTLADLVSYAERHNLANGEQGRDGHADNHSDNHGIEGPSADAVVTEARQRTRLDLLATVLFAQGTPMLLAGDEFGQTQGGNNNAYCQDNATSWLDWSAHTHEAGFAAAVARLIGLRRRCAALYAQGWLAGVHGDAALPQAGQVRWLGADGHDLPPAAWDAPASRFLAMWVAGPDDAALMLVCNAGEATRFALPAAAAAGWQLAFDSAAPNAPAQPAEGGLTLAARSVCVLLRGPPAH